MKKVAFIYSNIKFKDKIEYSINTIFTNYNIDYDVFAITDQSFDKKNYGVVIYYGNNNENIDYDINIIESNLFSENYLKVGSLPKEVKYFNTLPVLFFDSRYEFLENIKHNKIYINNDIIQTVFFFLTCYEDYVLNDYDKYGRINIEKSILYRNNLIDVPVVNKAIDYLINILISKYGLNIKMKPLWGNKKFAAILSHDVDSLSKFLPIKKELRLQLSILLGDKKPKIFFRRLYEFINKNINKSYKDPFDTFDYILSLEKKYSFKSSFYFMTDNKSYRTDDSLTKSILDKIKENNNEIGFHPGLGTSSDRDLFIKQKELFKKDMLSSKQFGVRQHYLSFISGSTFEIQESEGIMYDTSVCYPQVAGFKAGYCHPYKVYSLQKDKVLDLWEVPLIVMEGTLLQYMNLDLEDAKKYCNNLLNEIEKYNGVFVLLWHNSALSSEYNQHAVQLFEWIYKELDQRNCTVNSAVNIINKYGEQVGMNKDGY
jgi:hypothetical protein